MRGQASYFVWLNRSKESVSLDIKSEAGRKILDDLPDGADVFVQNLAPGAAARLGLDADSLRRVHTSLVVCDISGCGSKRLLAGRKAYDLLIQCETGVVSLSGSESEPAKAGISIADMTAGMYAYSGILSALYTRATMGRVPAVEVRLFDALAEWMGQPPTTPATRENSRCCCRCRMSANGHPKAVRFPSATSASPPTPCSGARRARGSRR
ncbi:crotonobetainyl-CoA:carnitine CoA-transferase CaiB-like acyl-CoA transferase [Streptomyces rapamycinicus]|uniref:CoA transferase n=2 Tax=Streptomyces rapamycinicus TaxID=1226757 RepID=A0A3L8QX61_STRRN|nr:crotonobetainyl-CoA:carnitine CoA-transferase CaiB-like acyl-CoA transferase [Streptomyces rapamycinicus]RLV71753.1 CoA transferase [Streptomyces rapamycinicus NRRL 5491]